MKRLALLIVFVMMLCTSAWQGFATEEESESVDMVELGTVEVEGTDETSDEMLEEIEDTGGLIVYSGETTKQVKLTYSKQLKYENYTTMKFQVESDGETHVAYCIQPGIKRSEEVNREAALKDMSFLQKALYYSYGYPGYEEKMKDRMAELDLKSCYSGDNGAYAFAHVLLSYVYQLEGGRSTPFKGVSESTQNIVKDLAEEMKGWPDPFENASLSLSKDKVSAKWIPADGKQRTEEIKLKGAEGNSIEVKAPEGAELICGDKKASPGEILTIKTGDSFYFTAGSDVTGSYESPEMEGSAESFAPYIIESGTKQDILFGSGKKDKVKFSVDWIRVPDNVRVTTSAAESRTGNKEIEAAEEIVISDRVSYQGLEPGLEYTLSGRLMDKETGDEAGINAEASFTPDTEDGEVIIQFKANGISLAGKKLVAFEKLYFDGKLLASHEDINDEEQSVSIKERPKEVIPSVGTGQNGKPGGENDVVIPPSTPAAAPGNTQSGSVPATGDSAPLGIFLILLLISALLSLKTLKCEG